MLPPQDSQGEESSDEELPIVNSDLQGRERYFDRLPWGVYKTLRSATSRYQLIGYNPAQLSFQFSDAYANGAPTDFFVFFDDPDDVENGSVFFEPGVPENIRQAVLSSIYRLMKSIREYMVEDKVDPTVFMPWSQSSSYEGQLYRYLVEKHRSGRNTDNDL